MTDDDADPRAEPTREYASMDVAPELFDPVDE
jgi:hypothetical protein